MKMELESESVEYKVTHICTSPHWNQGTELSNIAVNHSEVTAASDHHGLLC